MLNWNSEWGTFHAQLDEEHRKLYAMINSTLNLLRPESSTSVLAGAIEMFQRRMMIHFQMEEEMMRPLDRESHSILADDHGRLTAMIARLDADLPQAQLEQVFADIRAAISKHDREVDVPLFRLALTRHQRPTQAESLAAC